MMKVRYSQIDTDLLSNMINLKYNLPFPLSCQLYSSGMNDIYIFRYEKENFFLRISLTGMIKKKDLIEEIDFINMLHMSQLSVVRPIQCINGEYVWKINAPEGIRYAVMFAEIKSNPLTDKLSSAYNLGGELAKIHIVSDKKNFHTNRKRIDMNELISVPLKQLSPYFKNKKDDYQLLESYSQELKEYILNRLNYSSPIFGCCHGDMQMSNALFFNNHPTIFDFDCMGYGWRAYDISVYAWNETLKNKDFIFTDQWKAFIKGYTNIRNLLQEELDCIYAFAALRELWLMGLHANIINKCFPANWFDNSYLNLRITIFKLWHNRVFNLTSEM